MEQSDLHIDTNCSLSLSLKLRISNSFKKKLENTDFADIQFLLEYLEYGCTRVKCHRIARAAKKKSRSVVKKKKKEEEREIGNWNKQKGYDQQPERP